MRSIVSDLQKHQGLVFCSTKHRLAFVKWIKWMATHVVTIQKAAEDTNTENMTLKNKNQSA